MEKTELEKELLEEAIEKDPAFNDATVEKIE